MTRNEAVCFLNEAARYFERRPTKGEDAAHWSNTYNADNCRKIAAMITADITDPDTGRWVLLWAACDHSTLYESEWYDTLGEAEEELNACHEKYPWNTYYLVRVEQTKRGTGKIPSPMTLEVGEASIGQPTESKS
jgi:hypothetical protein